MNERLGATGVLLGLLSASAGAYPIYGSEDRGIRRLEGTRLAHEGVVHGRARLDGEILHLDEVDLRLLTHRDLELPSRDDEFTAEITAMLGENLSRYGIAVLDLSDPDRPRYAESRGDAANNAGSVGKVAIGLAVFQALADAYPDDTDARLQVLRNTRITADEFIVHDAHKVRFWDAARQRMVRRPLEIGDTGSLFEFLDWTLSASSNAAASMTLREAMLIHHFGNAYPPSDSQRIAFFDHARKAKLGHILKQTLQAPLSRNGLDVGRFRQGSFFTREGKNKVPGASSYATAREMMRFLLRLEQGRLVDAFSSRELKRLLYVTERRVRYASSPALDRSAVYLKSGSLYACQPEPGFTCKRYHGNKRNLMSSMAIVETPAGLGTLHYMVVLSSNVLRRNSAVDHEKLATSIHAIIARNHGYVPE